MEEEDSGYLHINNLPESILIRVFHYLALEELRLSVQLVCKHWQNLSFDRTLWRHCFQERTLLTDKTFHGLLQKVGRYIEVMDLDSCLGLSDVCLTYVAEFCTGLTSISWKQMPLTKSSPDVLRQFVARHPRLRQYDFNSDICCYPDVLEMCTGALTSLSVFNDTIKTGPDLHHDDDDATSQAKAASILTIVSQNPEIRSLMTNVLGRDDWLARVCQRCPRLDRLSIQGAVWTGTEALLAACQRLASLRELDVSETLIDDRCLLGVAERCPHLTKVNTSACRNITDTGITGLSERCRRVVELVLNDSQYTSGNVTDAGLCSVADNLPGLRVVHVSFCPSLTPAGIQTLAERCPDLEEIRTDGCISLTDRAFLALAAHCKRLRTINASQCLQLGSEAVAQILINLPRLTTLQLEACRSVTELRLRSTRAPGSEPVHDRPPERSSSERLNPGESSDGVRWPRCGTPNGGRPETESEIRHLSLSFCSKLLPSAVHSLASFCPKLTHVNLSACCQLTDSCLEALTSRCTRLRHLDISSGSTFRLAKLTDRTLYSIANNCRRLEELHVKTLFGISMLGLAAVVEACADLSSLSLTAGKNLPFGEVTQLLRHYRCGFRLWDGVGTGRLIDTNIYMTTFCGSCTFILSRLKPEFRQCHRLSRP